MAEKSSAFGRFEILRKIGRLRAEYWLLWFKEKRVLLKVKLDELIRLQSERARIGAQIAELRKKYDEIDKGGE